MHAFMVLSLDSNANNIQIYFYIKNLKLTKFER